MDDFREFIEKTVMKERRVFDWHDPQHDPEGLYPVDCRINFAGDEPVFVYALQSDDKVKDVTIGLHQFERRSIPHRGVGVFENQEDINRESLARFNDVCDKQFSNLGNYIVDESTRIGDYGASSANRIQPWLLKPYAPLSWWDMQHFSARGFFWIGQCLEHLQNDCLIGSHLGDPDEPVFNLAAPLEERTTKKALEAVKIVEQECEAVGLSIATETASEFRARLSELGPKDNSQWFMDEVRSLRRIIEKEMKGKIFIYLPPERAKFLLSNKSPYPFGKDVHQSFPSIQYDGVEAACSLAFVRPTAAVFHLMRTMEIALTALAAVFGVSMAHTNWAPAVDQIESRIRGMNTDPAWRAKPDWKDLQEGYAQAISTFAVIKDAWRNYTMHVRGKYTDEEAEHLFNNVKFFLIRLHNIGVTEKL